MKPYFRQGQPTQNLNPYSPDPVSPTLHDSKSATYLNPNAQQNRKFRETTYYPTTTKNTNFQFLRYSVKIGKAQRDGSSNQALPSSNFKMTRKMTQENVKTTTEPKEITSSGWKPYSPKQSENRSLNPEKKQEISIKQFIPSIRASDKKNLIQDKQASITKADKTRDQNFSHQKLAFTPKCAKNFSEIKQGHKFSGSFSSSNLLKEDHANSPTSESISSRLAAERKKSLSAKIEDFQKIKFLGEGKFGQVFLALHKKSNCLFAIKKIKKKTIVQNDLINQFTMEIKLQLYLDHPNILKLFSIFDDEENIYLLLEYMEEGTLYSQLKKKKVFKQGEASRKLRDVIEGMTYLHSQQVAHRDIKPQNIVISNDVCKICDLGWAAVCEDRRKTLCGTIDYASPELLEGKQYGTAIDLWCLGVLCYELMVGKAPFYHISRKETMKKIINTDSSDICLPGNIPIETQDFITRLLKKNPEERMSAEEALSHPLILKYQEQQLEDLRASRPKK